MEEKIEREQKRKRERDKRKCIFEKLPKPTLKQSQKSDDVKLFGHCHVICHLRSMIPRPFPSREMVLKNRKIIIMSPSKTSEVLNMCEWIRDGIDAHDLATGRESGSEHVNNQEFFRYSNQH